MAELPINQIVCGPCEKVMADWPDKCVDLVLTDPPYGIGKAGWDKFTDQWFVRARRFGSVAVFCGVKAYYDYPKADWVLAWVRAGSTQRNGALRGFNNWEPVLLYGVQSLENDVVSTRNYPQPEIEHETPKPIELMLKLIERLSEPNHLILDPFCGSGTTCVAAKMLGRRYIGIDISEEYCAIARERLKAVETNVPVRERRSGQLGLFDCEAKR